MIFVAKLRELRAYTVTRTVVVSANSFYHAVELLQAEDELNDHTEAVELTQVDRILDLDPDHYREGELYVQSFRPGSPLENPP